MKRQNGGLLEDGNKRGRPQIGEPVYIAREIRPTKRRRLETERVKELSQLRSGQFAKLVGCSLRQLQYWGKKNLVPPVRRGAWRYYEPEQVRRAKVLLELQKSTGRQLTRIKIPALALRNRFLLFSPAGSVVGSTNSRAGVIEIAKEAKSAVVLIDCGTAVATPESQFA